MIYNNAMKPVLYRHSLLQKRVCYIQVSADKRIARVNFNYKEIFFTREKIIKILLSIIT